MAQTIRPFLNVVAVPGRVGSEECSLDLTCFELETYHWFSFWDKGLNFSNRLNFFRHFSGSIYFLTIKSLFYNCY